MFILANPNVRTDDQETPLHVASFWGHGTIVSMLLVNYKFKQKID